MITFLFSLMLGMSAPKIGDWLAVKVWDSDHVFTVNTWFTRRMDAHQRRDLFRKATGDQKGSKWKTQDFATHSDRVSTITYTPDDGFRLYLLWDGAPEPPAWRFRKAEKPAIPMRIRKYWAEAVEMRDTIGVRMDVGAGIGIEWRADGGMRVWIGETAYDSYAPEPVSAPPTE